VGGAKLTILDFIKAMAPVAVRGEDGNSMAELLQPDRSVDNKPFRTANAQVGVNEPNVKFFFLAERHCVLLVIYTHSGISVLPRQTESKYGNVRIYNIKLF